MGDDTRAWSQISKLLVADTSKLSMHPVMSVGLYGNRAIIGVTYDGRLWTLHIFVTTRTIRIFYIYLHEDRFYVYLYLCRHRYNSIHFIYIFLKLLIFLSITASYSASGAAYVYSSVGAGTLQTWSYQATLYPAYAHSIGFGSEVSLYDDTAVVSSCMLIHMNYQPIIIMHISSCL